MAKIVYTHTKTDTSDWWTCPPSLEEVSPKWKNRLIRFWQFCGNKYIVDPVSHSQCLYIMLKEIPFGKFIMKFIKKEDRYEI